MRSQRASWTLSLLALSMLSTPMAWAGVGDGSVASITKIQDNGPDSDRFNIVIMGDGFTAAEMATYEARAQQVVDAFNAQATYGACGGGVNFYRVNVVSDQSGSDKPAPCYSPAVLRDTYLDSRYCQGGTQRCIWSANTALVESTAAAASPMWHFVVVLVNDPEHGGCAGGQVTFNATGPGFESTVMHELGHALGGLADEYEYGGAATYAGGEPSSPNLTLETDRHDVKWFDLIEETTPYPTWNRPDCSIDGELAPLALEGKVGAFEGGGYSRCGIFHPERTCLMRTLDTEFCAVCNRRVRQVMAANLSTGNLAITPWGYFKSPKEHPLWQTPDVWVDNDLDGVQEADEPLIGKSDNRLFARIRNTGSQPSGSFQVRFSYVPYTTVIDLANSQPIATVNRPSLGASGVDVVEVPWPLDAVPPEFAGIDHFCVIVEILHEECTTADNRAQNNFTSIQTASPAPATLEFFVTNILDVAAFGALEVELNPRRPGWTVRGDVADLANFPLAARETRKVGLTLDYVRSGQDDDEAVEADVDVTFRLEGQILGGVSSRVQVLPERRKWSLSLHLGASMPQDTMDLYYDDGSSVVVDVGYRLNRRLSVIGLLGNHRFDRQVDGLGDLELWSLSVGLRWDLSTGALRPYLQAAPGVYVPDSGSTELGYLVGAGVDFALTPDWDLELGVDYHAAPSFGIDVEFLLPHVGVIYRF